MKTFKFSDEYGTKILICEKFQVIDYFIDGYTHMIKFFTNDKCVDFILFDINDKLLSLTEYNKDEDKYIKVEEFSNLKSQNIFSA